jgi:hypothetical protein
MCITKEREPAEAGAPATSTRCRSALRIIRGFREFTGSAFAPLKDCMRPLKLSSLRELVGTSESRTKRSKYGNVKTEIGPRKYDSKKEAQRHMQLVLLERAGFISQLQCQVTYLLIPSMKKGDGKMERGIAYIADFTYMRNGVLVVEDSKGMRTKEYIIKRKLMLYIHKIEIAET